MQVRRGTAGIDVKGIWYILGSSEPYTRLLDNPPCSEQISHHETVLVPELKPGDVVILDNLGSHKGRAARAAIRAAGAHLLFLPPYSPDLNPIEQLFSKLKHFTRAGEPRTVEATWRRVGHVLDLVAPDECANYPTNSGYASV